MPSVFVRSSVAIAIPLLLSGCNLGRCDYESRYLTAIGRVTEGIAEVAAATLTVGAVRGGLRWRDVDYRIRVPLEGRVTSVTLILPQQPAPLRLDMPVYEQITPFEYAGGLSQRKDEQVPALGGIFEMVAAGGAVLEITTDLPARPLITLPLTITAVQDWYRSNNCY
ncbi:MAG: hypothetical protein WD802_00400 [Gemmatimonadaceae bacterium]